MVRNLIEEKPVRLMALSVPFRHPPAGPAISAGLRTRAWTGRGWPFDTGPLTAIYSRQKPIRAVMARVNSHPGQLPVAVSHSADLLGATSCSMLRNRGMPVRLRQLQIRQAWLAYSRASFWSWQKSFQLWGTVGNVEGFLSALRFYWNSHDC